MNTASDRSRRGRMLEGMALLLLAVSALAFQRAATIPWAEARSVTGSHVQVSPIGLSDFGMGTTGTPPTECRWWPKLGDQQLCALTPNGAHAMSRVRHVYPLVVIALWTAVLAIFLTAIRIPRLPRSIGLAVTLSLPIIAALAVYDVFVCAPRALAAIEGVSLDPSMPGFAVIMTAAACSVIAAALLIVSRSVGRPEGVVSTRL